MGENGNGAVNTRLEALADGIYNLVFDRPDSTANVLDRATLDELEAHLETLATSDARGLVVSSAKPAIFIAGADVRELIRIESEQELRRTVEQGQRIFERFAQLAMPTVAAIHGACLGGGCELVLALDARVASDSSRTRIGLPEVQLGILPAWGGSTRLVRLIGLPLALDSILRARKLRARSALRRGLVDELVPREILLQAARARLTAPKPRRRRHRVVNHRLFARLVGWRATKSVLAQTRGHYPAPPRALEVVAASAGASLSDSLARERDAVLALARTPAAKNLMRLFLSKERAKHLDPDDLFPDLSVESESGVERVAVIGAGTMGAGIAQWLCARRLRVILQDVDATALGRGVAAVGRLFGGGVRRRVFDRLEARDGMDRLFPATASVPLARTDLVIEAALEQLALKRDLMGQLEQRVGPQTVLVTNTSSLSIASIAAGLERPERLLGLHFFNPVHRMELVEIVVADQTDPALAARMIRFVQAIGKLPVVVKDRPGFLVNRILLPYLVEAGRLFAEGVSVQELDGAMLDFGMPMGPLRLLDEIGLDVALHVAGHLAQGLEGRLEVPDLFGRMVAAGHLGKKSGAGFYRYGKRTRVHAAVRRLAAAKTAQPPSRAQLQERMVLPMLNEAARCLEQGIVAGPEQVDLAMVIGTGFAPFRGGPLRYADSLGIGAVVAALERFARSHPRYAPAELLVSMAEGQRSFHERA